jgi:nucleotide-binding universal stress UspA family protein
MSYRTILVDLSATHPVDSRATAARELAARFGATLVGMHVMPQPFVPAGLYGETSGAVAGELIAAQLAANRDIGQRVRTVFHDVCGQGPDIVWREAQGDPGHLLAEAARTTDLVVTEKGEGGELDTFGAIEHLALAAGVPVLVLPPGVAGAGGRTVLIGWDGGREATRALHGALPFLVDARRVMLCAVGAASRTLEYARLMLRRHGVEVEPRHMDQPEVTAGEALLGLAGGEGADLLVMGAYGHTRLRELVFGGATRHVLHTATLPVLFGG